MGKGKRRKVYVPAVLYSFMRWSDVAKEGSRQSPEKTEFLILTGPRETRSMEALRGSQRGERPGVCSARQVGT